MNDKVLISQW